MRDQATDRYKFGPFILDIKEHLLLRDGKPQPLPPKVFNTLELLVQNSGHILSKDELMKAVWPDSFVEEANLTQNIFMLRKVLGESANSEHYIETVPKRGYRFTAPIEEVRQEAVPRPPEFVFRFSFVKLSIFVLSALLMVGLSVSYFLKEPVRDISSLAVLPFVNEGSDPNTDYLSDGITESIINSLSQLPRLKVMARNTVFSYKGEEVDPRKIGRELNVDVVLTGRLTQRGETLDIQTELVNVLEGSQLWGQHYNRRFADIFEMQDEIAKEISGQLRVKLTGDEQRRLTKRYTENIEAFQLYLKGRYYFDRRTTEGTRQSIGYFEEAIKKDPEYGLAYAGLANSYIPSDTVLPPRETIAKAKEAARKALLIDDTLAEAHTAQARVLQHCDWDSTGAEREFKRSIELNSKYAEAHHMYSHFLMQMGRTEESLIESRKALDLDPLDVLLHIHLAWTYIHARQYDQSMPELLKLVETESSRNEVHLLLGRVYLQKGIYDKAIEEFQRARSLPAGTGAAGSLLGYAYAASGNRHEALKVLNDLEKQYKQGRVSPYSAAVVYAGLRENDQAIEWLQKAFKERSGSLLLLKVEPAFDGLRSDPRFTNLLWRIGLPS